MPGVCPHRCRAILNARREIFAASIDGKSYLRHVSRVSCSAVQPQSREERELCALRTALAMFLLRDDLSPAAKSALSMALSGGFSDQFGALPDGRIALTTRALANMLSLGRGGSITLRQWRQRCMGPPYHVVTHGGQERALYLVADVQRWLRESTTEFRLHADPAVFEAFGLTMPSASEEAAA